MISIHSNHKERDIIIAHTLDCTKFAYPITELICGNKEVFC